MGVMYLRLKRAQSITPLDEKLTHNGSNKGKYRKIVVHLDKRSILA